jgi:hypothetical protein
MYSEKIIDFNLHIVIFTINYLPFFSIQHLDFYKYKNILNN